MSAQAQKQEEVVPVQKSKLESAVQKKLISLILCFVSFAVMYFALGSESEVFMWVALLFTIACSGYLFSKN